MSQLITKLNDQHKLYSTQEMRKDFLHRCHTLMKTSKSVLRNVYKTLMGDSSSATSEVERVIDERVAEALLTLDNLEIV